MKHSSLKKQMIKTLCWSSVALQAALTVVGFATGAWGMGTLFGVHTAVSLAAARTLDEDDRNDERIQRMLGSRANSANLKRRK